MSLTPKVVIFKVCLRESPKMCHVIIFSALIIHMKVTSWKVQVSMKIKVCMKERMFQAPSSLHSPLSSILVAEKPLQSPKLPVSSEPWLDYWMPSVFPPKESASLRGVDICQLELQAQVSHRRKSPRLSWIKKSISCKYFGIDIPGFVLVISQNCAHKESKNLQKI